MGHIDFLANETLQHIFGYLPHLNDRKRLSMVCHRWNDLAFGYSYLGHVKLRVRFDLDMLEEVDKISRRYRTVQLACDDFELDEEKTRNVLAWFERPCASVEEFLCDNPGKALLALELLPVCPKVKKVQFHMCWNVSDSDLPILENLEDVKITCMSAINLIRLAPNLRKLRTRINLFNLPTVVQKLPLEHLQVDHFDDHIDIFEKCTEPTKLTSVSLYFGPIYDKGLEQLSKFCPLLTKLRISVTPTTSLQCLASLTHLKTLGLEGYQHNVSPNQHLYLPSVEIVEFALWKYWHFDSSMQRTFPNVHHLILRYENFYKDWDINSATGKISDGFPQLRTLDISDYRFAAQFELLEGLSKLRQLIVWDSRICGGFFPPMNIQQLTLKNTVLRATKEMARHLPELQFLDLLGKRSRCDNWKKLPSSWSIRRYIWSNNDDVFDVE